MTFSQEPTPEAIEQQRLLAVHGFTLGALGLNGWINSVGAREDVRYDLMTLEQGTHYSATEPLQWRRNLAAMRIMQTIATGIDGEAPFVILPEITEAQDVYDGTSATVAEVGLDRLPPYDKNLLVPIVKCFVSNAPAKTPAAAAVQHVRRERGFVDQEIVSIAELAAETEKAARENAPDYIQILPNGMFAEVFPMPPTPVRSIRIPFYLQYVNASKGAEEYLRAFREDVEQISHIIAPKT